MSQVRLAIPLTHIYQFFIILGTSSADIQKSATGITFSTTRLYLIYIALKQQ